MKGSSDISQSTKSPPKGPPALKYFSNLLPFAAGLLILLLSSKFVAAAGLNALAQLTLFVTVVCVPLYRTGSMSYVDIGWPVGIVLIALSSVTTLEGYWPRALVCGVVYTMIGARMANMAIGHLLRGELKEELPRYAYQRRRWEKSGKSNTMLAAQTEVLAQGAFNASFLAMPAFIIASTPSHNVSLLEWIGLGIWVLSFVFEELSDRQKREWIKRQKELGIRDGVCDQGLWAYSRHPNYFGQWMGWNGIIIAAIPSWLALYEVEHFLFWIGL